MFVSHTYCYLKKKIKNKKQINNVYKRNAANFVLNVPCARLPTAEPLGPLGLVVDVLDFVHGHWVRPVDGYRHFLLDVHRVRFLHRVWHGLFDGIRHGFDDGHGIRHLHGHGLRNADGNSPVHGHRNGAVDFDVLRDHLFGSVRRRVSGGVSKKSHSRFSEEKKDTRFIIIFFFYFRSFPSLSIRVVFLY